jgi:hypothetical protein
MRLPDSRAGAMSCLTGIAIRNSIDQKRPIRIADLVKVLTRRLNRSAVRADVESSCRLRL